MRVYHNTRELTYRKPFGAVRINETIYLNIDVWETTDVSVALRTWVDGKGERILPMEKEIVEDHLHFHGILTPDTPQILWYSFILRHGDGHEERYGAKQGFTGGEGMLYAWEPPSFQITVYQERKVPDWYKKGIVYQIFPDRFFKGEDAEKLLQTALSEKRAGPLRKAVEDWNTVPFYKKDNRGRVTQWDFYGGTLSGIQSKLSYLKELGVTALYLNPIFKASSNHRYDTADFMHIDEILGGEQAFEKLIQEADNLGISIILDGVFNHTGCDSIYFDKYRNYDGIGAFENPQSSYRDWYRFNDSPAGYDCWWGVDDLPNVEETASSYQDYIYRSDDSVVRHWLRAGAKGWRLDVADELPDAFIAGIKTAAIEEKPKDALVLGEVWEDASNKISYGKLRKYLLGGELDSVMNYPLLDAVHGFLLGRVSASKVCETLTTLQENYPPEAFYAALNLMGSHDRPRIMTLMGEAPNEHTLSEEEKRDYRLSDHQRGLAKGRIWLMTLLQMTLPGVPCIYYGDEAGMEGYADPYNRGPYPWGNEDKDLAAIYRNAISLRRMYDVFVDGSFEPFYDGEDVFGFYRNNAREHMAVLINRSLSNSYSVKIKAFGEDACELIGGRPVAIHDGMAEITLWPMASAVIYFQNGPRLGKPMQRGSGVLCHITSLPNDIGHGTIGQNAKDFIDFLAVTGQKYWQILPLNPTDEHGSPYAGTSAFAGNTWLLPDSEEELRKQFESFVSNSSYQDFCRENASWLLPYSTFTALKKRFVGQKWSQWPEEYRRWSPEILQDTEIARETDFISFCQYRFQMLWSEIRSYATQKGIAIIGDMPMYVSEDSSDVWAQPELFALDEDGHKTVCAGVPPDYFAKDGQLWGNPLYNWDKMKEEGYDWWMRRFQRAFELYDFTRIDHFRGFESYWMVPEGKKASAGKWIFGPGKDLFETAFQKFGPLPVLAEDLGLITPAVRGLLAQCGFPGASVLQFYDGDPKDGYIPPKNKIAYTGTHDNQTLVGWCLDRYPDRNPQETAWELMTKVMNSEAEIVIVPLQDVLGLDDEARMNTPGTTGANWSWQANAESMDSATEKFKELTAKANR